MYCLRVQLNSKDSKISQAKEINVCFSKKLALKGDVYTTSWKGNCHVSNTSREKNISVTDSFCIG